jgi:hypothetical protein
MPMTPDDAPSDLLPLRRIPALGLVTALVLAIGLGLTGVLGQVADLHTGALPPHPFFLPEHALLLYVAMPLAVLGVVGMLLAPGFLLALVTGSSRYPGLLAATSFGGAFLLRVLAHSLLKLSGAVPLTAGAFALTEVTLDTALIGLLVLRLRSGRPVFLSMGPEARRRLGWMVAIVVLMAVLLLPTLFWQDMPDDGVEALEVGRSLTTFVVPRFPTSPSGFFGLGVGMLSLAYPIGWFVSLIGPFEAAARLPLVLYLPVLFALICGLCEWGSPRRLGLLAEGAIVLALAAYVATMVFSASYSPYYSDASAPAALETMTVLCMAATILCAWQGRNAWMVFFALMAYFARPTGLMVLGLLAIGAALLPGAERRAQLIRLAVAIAACLVAAVAYEKLFLPRAAHGLAVSFTSGSILERFRYLTFTDLRRILFLVVPCGILPALALFAWGRQDPKARQVTVVCFLYFLFFYPQAFIALHHFVPVMILPVVVYWRIALAGTVRWPATAATIAAGLALVLSMPRSFGLDRSMRAIGMATDVQVGNLNGDWTEHGQALSARYGVRFLFPPGWEVPDPSRNRVGSQLGLIYYASRTGPDADAPNYVIQPAEAAPRPGFSAVGELRGLAVFVRDTARWRRDRETPPPTHFASAIYDIPRSTLHRYVGVPAHAYQVDLARVPLLWRFF